MDDVHVVIVGGGPAGLNAALVLGRACRKVVVFDEGRPRNAVSRGVHNFLSRDGTPPGELLGIAREQLAAYPNVRFVRGRVVEASRRNDGFEVVSADGHRLRCRKLILATGLVDRLPAVPGMLDLYGHGVFSCPYCDGWEAREQPIAVYGRCDQRGSELALEMLGWSREVSLCTDGEQGEEAAHCASLERNGIQLRRERVVSLDGEQGWLRRVVFERGPALETRALFVWGNYRESSDLALQVGSAAWSPQKVQTEPHGRAGVPGLFVAGDASRGVLQVAIAAAEGCEAAICANTELLREDRR
jgi:thioredoxin reductase